MNRRDIWMGRDLESIFKKEGTGYKNFIKRREKSKKICHFLKRWDLFTVVSRIIPSSYKKIYFNLTQSRSLSLSK